MVAFDLPRFNPDRKCVRVFFPFYQVTIKETRGGDERHI